MSQPAGACPVDSEGRYESEFAAAPPMWNWQLRTNTIPARPSFYGFLGSAGLNELPVFTRSDGTVIRYSAPQPVRNSGSLYRIDLAVDEGVVLVQYPGYYDRQMFVIDPRFVPRTHSTVFETDRTGTWMRVDSDAVVLRVERADGTFDIENNPHLVLLSPTKVRVAALYGDGREEQIFERSSTWSPPPPPPTVTAASLADGSEDRHVPDLALLLVAIASCAAIARRASASGDASLT